MVRRDWSPLSKDCGNFALDAILSGRPREDVVDAIHAKLHEVISSSHLVGVASCRRKCLMQIPKHGAGHEYGNAAACITPMDSDGKQRSEHWCHAGRKGRLLGGTCLWGVGFRVQSPSRAQQVREKLAAGAVPLGKFVITKQLTRRPEEYPDAKSQPHVQVALRRKAQNRRDGTLPVRGPHACAGCAMLIRVLSLVHTRSLYAQSNIR